jgi:putative ABC transport system permease protein
MLLAALLVLLAIATTAHLLVTGVRRRRRDFGLLRAIGFTGRQLRTSVLIQASTLVALALVVAVPTGVLAGRALWALTATWLGIPIHNVVPLATIGAVVVAALLVGNSAAMVPAIAAGHVRPADSLRTE